MMESDNKNLLKIFALCLLAHLIIMPMFSFVLPQKTKKPKYQFVYLYQEPQSKAVNVPETRINPQLPVIKPATKQKIQIPIKETGIREENISIGIPKTPVISMETQEQFNWQLPLHRISLTGPEKKENLQPPLSTEQPEGKTSGENFEITGPGGNRPIITKVIPQYPSWAEQQGIEANVKIKIWVNKNGLVQSTEVIETSGYRKLDAVAEESLKKWRFAEIEKDINVWAIVTFKFRLQ